MINRYFRRLESDKGNQETMASEMFSRRKAKNEIQEIVKENNLKRTTPFKEATDNRK